MRLERIAHLSNAADTLDPGEQSGLFIGQNRKRSGKSDQCARRSKAEVRELWIVPRADRSSPFFVGHVKIGVFQPIEPAQRFVDRAGVTQGGSIAHFATVERVLQGRLRALAAKSRR
jgi:hypothetical protein